MQRDTPDSSHSGTIFGYVNREYAQPMNEIADFSKTFAQLLRGVMAEHGVTVQQVATYLGRSKGFVSERTSGVRAPDTDIINAVVTLSGVKESDLLVELGRRLAATEH